MQLFYAPHIDTDSELPEEEAAHALRVLRLKEGDDIHIIDGKGFFYKATLCGSRPKHCSVIIRERIAQKPLWTFNLHIAVAPTKNIDRMEWLVEKATEIGIDAITFLHCRHSERKEIKINRLEKIAISAMKQSGKARLPQLTGMVPFKEIIRQPFSGRRFIAHCEESQKTLLKETYVSGQDALLLIGPEGDFSKEEIQLAIENGFEPVSLGESRLRTETAALVGCHSLQLLNQI